MMSSIDETAIRMEMTRKALASSKLARQGAVYSFPIAVFSMARAMMKVQQMISRTGETKEARETLDYLEKQIRDEFRRWFGKEMVDVDD